MAIKVINLGCHVSNDDSVVCMYIALHVPMQVTCRVQRPYNGSCCPMCSYGVMATLCIPRCGEPTVAVSDGDIMVITRWEKKWVYGRKVVPEGEHVNISVNVCVTLKDVVQWLIVLWLVCH